MVSKIKLDEDLATIISDAEKLLKEIQESYNICIEIGLVKKLSKMDPKIYNRWIQIALIDNNQIPVLLKPADTFFAQLTRTMQQLDEKSVFIDNNLKDEIDQLKSKKTKKEAYKILAYCLYRIADRSNPGEKSPGFRLGVY